MKKLPFKIYIVRYPLDVGKTPIIKGTCFLYDLEGRPFGADKQSEKEPSYCNKKSHQLEVPMDGPSGNPHTWLFW